MLSEKNLNIDSEELSEWLREKFIGQEAKKIVNAVLVLEAFDRMPPIKTNLAEALEELIRRMANNPKTSQKILNRAVQKLDFLDTE